MTKDLTLEDLVKRSGLPLRTLRFYIQEGILPGPDTHGKNARYSQPHLDRLELIKRLKNLRLPLQEIRHLLNNMNTEEISQLLQLQGNLRSNFSGSNIEKDERNAKSSIPDNGSSALEYIRALELGRENIKSIGISTGIDPDISNLPLGSPPASAPDKHEFQPAKDQETWRRIVIDEGIELNVRETGGDEEEEKVRKLIEMARTLFGKHK